jgi:transposase-like protein
MAHASEKRTQLRGLFVYQRLPMEAACKKVGIPKSTANRWKQEAKDHGDDWDTSRAAVALGDESFRQLSVKLLEDYLVQHQATMRLLHEAKDLTPMQRATTLASMSDSFNKTMASFRRLSPEINRQAIALDVMQRFATFAQNKFPRHVPVLLELLEPFGEEIAKAYG